MCADAWTLVLCMSSMCSSALKHPSSPQTRRSKMSEVLWSCKIWSLQGCHWGPLFAHPSGQYHMYIHLVWPFEGYESIFLPCLSRHISVSFLFNIVCMWGDVEYVVNILVLMCWWKDQRPALAVFLNCTSCFKTGRSLSLELTDQLDWLASEFQESACLWPPGLELQTCTSMPGHWRAISPVS